MHSSVFHTMRVRKPAHKVSVTMPGETLRLACRATLPHPTCLCSPSNWHEILSNVKNVTVCKKLSSGVIFFAVNVCVSFR